MKSLEEIAITDELGRRLKREPDFEAESRLLASLADELAFRPHNLLQKLTDLLVDFGIGDSAAIAILGERDGAAVFHREAVSGPCASARGSTVPADATPTGIVVQQDRMYLFAQPGDLFSGVQFDAPVHEMLVVPFHDGSDPVGALWILSHRQERRFDAEDARLLSNLSRFAAAGFRTLKELKATKSEGDRFFDLSVDLLAIASITDRSWQRVNPAFQRILGWSPDELIGHSFLDHVHPDDVAATIATVEGLRDTGFISGFQHRMECKDGSYRTIQWHTASHSVAGELFCVGRDVTEQKAAERRQQTLLAELQHRVRNTLAVVRSIVRRTAETSQTVEGMESHLQGRLAAFTRVQTALTRSLSGGIDLTSLIEDELLAFAAHDGAQVRMRGPSIALKARPAESLSLAIHELATNAVKYGALSEREGRVEVSWQRDMRDGQEWLDLLWQEAGGPGVDTEPQRQGFGFELLQRSLPYDLRGTSSTDLRADGFRFTLSMPLGPDVLAED